MNFLGHLLMSGDDPMVITGNFMADAVKGRDLSRFSDGLQHGIRLHRHIDVFTDNHDLTLQGRERLRAHCGKYAGVALDLFYDHVIAKEWHHLHPETLEAFTQRMYALLLANAGLMPDRTQQMLPYMVRYDWLRSYTHVEGIGRALAGLARRVPGGEALVGAETVLVEHMEAYGEECMSFLRDLRKDLEGEEVRWSPDR